MHYDFRISKLNYLFGKFDIQIHMLAYSCVHLQCRGCNNVAFILAHVGGPSYSSFARN